MKQKVLKQLTTALRSGEYKQCRGALKTNVYGTYIYCCLGVLTELAIKSGEVEGLHWIDLEEEVERKYASIIADSKSSSTTLLIDSVMEWAGLDDNNPTLLIRGKEYTAMELNDELLSDFDEIADAFEESFGE